MIDKKFASQQEEIEDKKKKLQKLYNKYQSARSEVLDLQDEFTRERETYQDQIRELTRQLKLKSLMIENFIPTDEINKIELRAQWSEEIDDWVLPNLHLSGNSLRAKRPSSALGLKRPTSEYARLAKNLGDTNPRFRYDNIMQLDLDMPPEKYLDEFDGTLSQKVQNTINTGLNEDEDEISMLNLESQPNVYFVYKEDGSAEREDNQTPKEKKPTRLKSAMKKPGSAVKKELSTANTSAVSTTRPDTGARASQAEDNFPKAKGLVSKKPTK